MHRFTVIHLALLSLINDSTDEPRSFISSIHRNYHVNVQSFRNGLVPRQLPLPTRSVASGPAKHKLLCFVVIDTSFRPRHQPKPESGSLFFDINDQQYLGTRWQSGDCSMAQGLSFPSLRPDTLSIDQIPKERRYSTTHHSTPQPTARMKFQTLTLLLLTLLAATLTLATANPEPVSLGVASDVSIDINPPSPIQSNPTKPTQLTHLQNTQWGKSACLTRFPNVQRAIEMYCRPRDKWYGFMVPGAAANNIKQFGNARVTIEGGCNPAQWLPWDICFKQFYDMCSSSTDRGQNNRAYGRDKCQKWVITNPK
jgi:hypothetical protein